MESLDKDKVDENYIDIRDLLTFLWKRKVLICALTALMGAASVVYSFTLINEYTVVLNLSEVKQDEETSLTNASLDRSLGFSLPGLGSGNGLSNDMNQVITLMKSWSFVDEFIRKNNLEVPILAGMYWDNKTRKMVLDQTIYDEKNNKWVNDNFDIEDPAVRWGLYKDFLDEMRIMGDDDTGIHKLSVTSYSPDLALDWATKFYQLVNSTMREEKLFLINKNIKNLQTQIQLNSNTSLRDRLYDIQSEQIKLKIVIEASPDYILKPIGKALPPYERSFPRKKIIVLGTTFTSFIVLILFFIVYRSYFQQRKSL